AISSFRKALRPPNQNNFQVHLLLTLLYTVGNQMEQARFQAREMLRIRPFFLLKSINIDYGLQQMKYQTKQ
ncbi:MAG: hypothetical protein ACK2TU_06735, partial [Anaerolineales bacterium]